jgi:hypothetical protein
MRTATKQAIKTLKFRMAELEKQLERVTESALADDRTELMTQTTEELQTLNEAISFELYTRKACIDAEKEARDEEEREDVWNKLPERKRWKSTYTKEQLEARKAKNDPQSWEDVKKEFTWEDR